LVAAFFRLGRRRGIVNGMNTMRIALATIIAVLAGMSVSLSPAEARCFRDCRYHAWPPNPRSAWVRNQWGYGGPVQTWGLGGPADAPWVGGAVTGVTPYAWYPYDHVRGL
jgi:hypothetical protein